MNYLLDSLNDYCLQGSLGDIIDVLDTYTDPSSLQTALEIVAACSCMHHCPHISLMLLSILIFW